MAYLDIPNHPLKNISKDVFKALVAVTKGPDRPILSTGRGICVVVMDK